MEATRGSLLPRPGRPVAERRSHSTASTAGATRWEQTPVAGHVTVHSNVSAGAIEGRNAQLTSELGNLTLTGLTSSVLDSLTLTQPESNYYNEQAISINSELDVYSALTWSSNNVWLKGPGAIVAEPGSTTLFDPSAWINFEGGQFVNEGTATWTAGGFDSHLDSGTFFVNRGTFNADQDASNPVVYGCKHEVSEIYSCPVFENAGIFTAIFPSGHPHIEWRVDIVNYGTARGSIRGRTRCHWEFSEVPGPGAEACYRAIREFEGLLLQQGAAVD